MKLKDFKKSINFFDNLRTPVIGLAGGEPTLHPQFEEFVKLICTKSFPVINILTNGLFLKNDWIKWYGNIKGKETRILFNVRSPDTYSNNEWDLLNENIRVAMDLIPHNVHIGTTLTSDFSKQEEIMKFMLKYKIFDHRISLSAPSFNYDNKFVRREELKKMGKMVTQIINTNLENKIMTHIDCPIPPCTFDEKDFYFVRRWGERLRFRCAPPPLDITPNLDIWYCSSMRDYGIEGMKIDDFKHFQTLFEVYLEIERRLSKTGIRKQPLFNSCHKCEKWVMCMGGCLKLKLKYI